MADHDSTVTDTHVPLAGPFEWDEHGERVKGEKPTRARIGDICLAMDSSATGVIIAMTTAHAIYRTPEGTEDVAAWSDICLSYVEPDPTQVIGAPAAAPSGPVAGMQIRLGAQVSGMYGGCGVDGIVVEVARHGCIIKADNPDQLEKWDRDAGVFLSAWEDMMVHVDPQGAVLVQARGEQPAPVQGVSENPDVPISIRPGQRVIADDDDSPSVVRAVTPSFAVLSSEADDGTAPVAVIPWAEVAAVLPGVRPAEDALPSAPDDRDLLDGVAEAVRRLDRIFEQHRTPAIEQAQAELMAVLRGEAAEEVAHA